jgi:hypothetical protein
MFRIASEVSELVHLDIVNSRNYTDANEKSEYLEEFGPYSDRQIAEIIAGSIRNRQVYEVTTANRRLRHFFEHHGRDIDEALAKEFREVFGT